jgi:hypothetical protein
MVRGGGPERGGVVPMVGPEEEVMAEQVFRVTLRTVPGCGTPVNVRLRQFLKSAIRAWGLKAIEIEEVKAAEASGDHQRGDDSADRGRDARGS